MNFLATFLALTEYTIPFGFEETLEPLLPKGWTKDPVGNYFYEIGSSETLFTAHLDTHSKDHIKVIHKITTGESTFIQTDGTSILGADNKAGCCILFYMIEQQVPGTYYFFIGEEAAVHGNTPYGAIRILEHKPEFFKRFKRSIAFDRVGYTDIVSRQIGRNCASDDFVNAVIGKFPEIPFQQSLSGYYTDNAFFIDHIPEIINISAGSFNSHTMTETVNISYVEFLAIRAAQINWEDLPTIRILTSDIQADSVVSAKWLPNPDRDIFKEMFALLSTSGYVCHELRDYKSFLSHFKSGRIYHFSKWHSENNYSVSVSKGKITLLK